MAAQTPRNTLDAERALTGQIRTLVLINALLLRDFWFCRQYGYFDAKLPDSRSHVRKLVNEFIGDLP